jgi:hypothetical protein
LIVIPAKEHVREFDIERFLILRQAQDEEMDGILPLILSLSKDAARDSMPPRIPSHALSRE